MKCVRLKDKKQDHVISCFKPSYTASSLRKETSPMFLGFYTHLSHKGYSDCKKVLTWKIPFIGYRDLFSWDVSKTDSIAARRKDVNDYLSGPDKWN